MTWIRRQTGPREAAGSRVALPSVRRADVLAALALMALVVFAFWEVAVGGRTLTTSIGRPGVSGDRLPPGYGSPDFTDPVHLDAGASAWQFEPWAEIVHRELTRGEVPLWNPYQGAGAPLAANMQSAAFDPVLLPVHLHPSPRVWDLTILAVFAAGAVAAYAFGRLLGLGAAASFTGGAAFVLSGFFMLYSNNHYVRIYCYLPVLLALAEVLLRTRSLLPVAGLAAMVALVLLGGMPEAAFFVLATFGAFALYRIVWGPRAMGRPGAIVRIGFGSVVGVMLAAPALLPFAEYLSASLNLHDPTTGLQADPVHRALLWVVPYLNGPPSAAGGGTGIRSWVGLAVPALGVVAVGVPSAMRRHHGWFFLGCAVVLLLKQFGAGVVQWIGQLPVANHAIFKLFSAPVTAFCLAMLAAIGVQVIEDRLVRRRRLLAGVVALLLLVLAGIRLDAASVASGQGQLLVGQLGIAAAGGLLVVVAAAGLPARMTVAAAGVLLAAGVVVAGMASPGTGTVWRPLVLAGAAAVLLVLIVRPPHGGAARAGAARAAALVACLAVAAELLVLVPRGIYARLWDPYEPPAWLEALQRVAGPTDRVFGLNGVLYPNTAGAFGLQDVRTLDALYVRRYVEYMRTFVEPEFDDRFTGRTQDEPTPPDMDANPMWDLLGVRWVLSSNRWRALGDVLPPNVLRMPLIASEAGVDVREDPVQKGSPGERDPVGPASREGRSGPLPRAFVVHRAHRVGTPKEAIGYLSRAGARFPDGAVRVEGFDPASEVVVEGPVGTAAPATGALDSPGASEGPAVARIVSYGADRVVVSVGADRPGVLVLTDVYFPGWKATVNGRRAPVLPADVAFRGVEVGAGRSTVVFSYEPQSLRIGVAVAVLGLAALAVVAGLGLFRRPRRPRRLESPHVRLGDAVEESPAPSGARASSAPPGTGPAGS